MLKQNSKLHQLSLFAVCLVVSNLIILKSLSCTRQNAMRRYVFQQYLQVDNVHSQPSTHGPPNPNLQKINSSLTFNTTSVPAKQYSLQWKYDRVMCTGLGDRLCLIFVMAGLSHTANAQIHFRWCDTARRRDYKPEELEAALHLPSNVVLVPGRDFDNATRGMPAVEYENTEIRAQKAYDCVHSLAPKTFRAPVPVNISNFATSYHALGREWQLRLPVEVAKLGKYVVLHLRGDDKDDFAFHNFSTIKAIRAVVSAKLRLVVISDDHRLEQEVLRAAFTNPAAHIISEGNAYHHIAILHGAAGIVQHSPDGWSAFSSSVAMFRGIPLLNTWTGGFNRILDFERIGGRTFELRACQSQDDVNRFIADVRARK
jgi:hypothetical protein